MHLNSKVFTINLYFIHKTKYQCTYLGTSLYLRIFFRYFNSNFNIIYHIPNNISIYYIIYMQKTDLEIKMKMLLQIVSH